MRYLVAAFFLLGIGLPLIHVWAAPAPAPSAILQIAPPPKGVTEEQYHKDQIEGQTCIFTLSMLISDPEVKKLPSVAHFEDARPWLAKNLRVTEEKGGRLRFTFGAGAREEQVTILNALLRANLATQWDVKWGEECLRTYEKGIRENEARIRSSRDPKEIATLRKGIDNLRSVLIPELRTEIARRKQFAAVKWAK